MPICMRRLFGGLKFQGINKNPFQLFEICDSERYLNIGITHAIDQLVQSKTFPNVSRTVRKIWMVKIYQYLLSSADFYWQVLFRARCIISYSLRQSAFLRHLRGFPNAVALFQIKSGVRRKRKLVAKQLTNNVLSGAPIHWYLKQSQIESYILTKMIFNHMSKF